MDNSPVQLKRPLLTRSTRILSGLAVFAFANGCLHETRSVVPIPKTVLVEPKSVPKITRITDVEIAKMFEPVSDSLSSPGITSIKIEKAFLELTKIVSGQLGLLEGQAKAKFLLMVTFVSQSITYFVALSDSSTKSKLGPQIQEFIKTVSRTAYGGRNPAESLGNFIIGFKADLDSMPEADSRGVKCLEMATAAFANIFSMIQNLPKGAKINALPFDMSEHPYKNLIFTFYKMLEEVVKAKFDSSEI